MTSPTQARLPASVLFLTLLLPNVSSGQEKIPRNDSALIIATVTVKNRSGEYVMGLKREAFELADEKEIRPIEFFESADNPLSIGILIDASESMDFDELKEFTRPQSIAEAVSGLFELGNAGNEYFVMAFGNKPRLLTDWMSGQALLSQKPQSKLEKGYTAIYDACLAAIEKLRTGRHSRKALILVSDGLDNSSRHILKEVRDSLRNSDVILYGILVRKAGDLSSDVVEGDLVMAELTDATGGEVLVSRNKKQLNGAIEVIAT